MNKNREFQPVPLVWVERARQWGQNMVEWYASDIGKRSASRSVSGPWGAESNPVRQTQARVGEIATALFFGLDPNIAVKWNFGTGGDRGHDLVLYNGTHVDVKTTLPPFQLIWPKTINHLYWDSSKQFDVLLSVSVHQIDLSQCWLEGWLTKKQFFERKQVSDGINSGLDPGTWFIGKAKLNPIKELLAIDRQPDLFGSNDWDEMWEKPYDWSKHP